MLDALSRLSAEMFSSQVFVTLVGVFVGGLLGLFGVRQASAAQFKIQREEWERRDREKEQERRDRETRENDEKERQGTAAVQALAVEALWNSNYLLGVAKSVKNSPDTAPIIKLSREQFDKNFLLAMQRLNNSYLQLTMNTYLSGFSLQQSREARKALPTGALELEAIEELSNSFVIIFRSLGYHVFSREELQEFQMTRNVIEARK